MFVILSLELGTFLFYSHSNRLNAECYMSNCIGKCTTKSAENCIRHEQEMRLYKTHRLLHTQTFIYRMLFKNKCNSNTRLFKAVEIKIARCMLRCVPLCTISYLNGDAIKRTQEKQNEQSSGWGKCGSTALVSLFSCSAYNHNQGLRSIIFPSVLLFFVLFLLSEWLAMCILWVFDYAMLEWINQHTTMTADYYMMTTRM